MSKSIDNFSQAADLNKIVEPGKETRIPVLDLAARLYGIRGRPSFTQFSAFLLAAVLLGFICLLSVILLIVWWVTNPSVAEVRELLGTSVAPEKVLEALRSLQRDYFDYFRDLFQIVILSSLVPLFTLLAGYAFGAREREKSEQEEQE